jgi:uncharacterized protein YbjT (DUF2867 family)
MRVAVTGSTGFVGIHLAHALVQAGHSVIAVSRTGTDPKNRMPRSGVELRRADVTVKPSLTAALAGAEAVVHLVGIIREFGNRTFHAIHVGGTRNAVDAGKANGIRRFIHVSALGTRPDAPSLYHQTKAVAEEIVQTSGLDWTILRPALIFGENGLLTTQLAGLVKGPFVPVLGHGQTRYQPVDVRDVVRAVTGSLERPEASGRTFDVAGPEVLTFDEMMQTVSRVVCGREKRLLHIPVWSAQPLAATLGRMTPLFPVGPDQIVMLGEDGIAESQEAVDLFGLEQATFAVGLERICGRPAADAQSRA